MKAGSAIEALGALAQEHRLALFRLLVQAGDKGMPAGAIAEALGVSQQLARSTWRSFAVPG